jgi:hypothetical protein
VGRLTRPLGGWRPHGRLSPRRPQGVAVSLSPEKIVVLFASSEREGRSEDRSLGLVLANPDESICVEVEIPDLDELISNLEEGRAWIAEGG